MPWTSLKEANWLRNALLSTGLVGSWFFSCASSSVRKSVPPSVTPLGDPPFAVLEPLEVEPLVGVVPLVPVGAVLVAGIRLRFIDVELSLRRRGHNGVVCNAEFKKGEEMGWFEHGSTILVIARGSSALCDNVRDGAFIRVGEPLMRLA